MYVLKVKDLRVEFRTETGVVQAVDSASFHLQSGETLALVGETGCGKSVTALSVMGLLPKPQGRIVYGSIRLEGEELVSVPETKLRAVRGRRIAMVFQDPLTSLNPVLTVGQQLGEVTGYHHRLRKADVAKKSLELLRTVKIPDPDRIIHRYPFQLSGGMRQRVMIALALACEPQVLIADEPTTALDVTVQAQILALITEIQKALSMGILLITHDLGVVKGIANRVAIMYAGRIVETGTVADVFSNSLHPYTKGLLAALPRTNARHRKLAVIPGTVPDLVRPPGGCRFHPRCQYAVDVCRIKMPPMLKFGEHFLACHVQGGPQDE